MIITLITVIWCMNYSCKPLKFCCEVFDEQIVDNTATEVWNADSTTDSVHATVDCHDCDIRSLTTNTQHEYIAACNKHNEYK